MKRFPVMVPWVLGGLVVCASGVARAVEPQMKSFTLIASDCMVTMTGSEARRVASVPGDKVISNCTRRGSELVCDTVTVDVANMAGGAESNRTAFAVISEDRSLLILQSALPSQQLLAVFKSISRYSWVGTFVEGEGLISQSTAPARSSSRTSIY